MFAVCSLFVVVGVFVGCLIVVFGAFACGVLSVVCCLIVVVCLLVLFGCWLLIGCFVLYVMRRSLFVVCCLLCVRLCVC